MYRVHPQTETLRRLLAERVVGEVGHLRASFGHCAQFDPGSRLFRSALGGGVSHDVGCYPVSVARLVGGTAAAVASRRGW